MYLKSSLLEITPTNPRIIEMLNLTKKLNLTDKKILDIGCHDGSFLNLLKKRTTKLYGLEASQAAVKVCLKNKISAKAYFFDDSTPMPYPDSSFDLIVAGEIIEHIYHTDLFLQEIHRLLKPHGHLLISTPNIASLGRRILLASGISPLLEDSLSKIGSAGHIRYFTFKSLDKLLSDNNFKAKVVKSDHINFDSSGKIKSKYLATLFPAFGQSIIGLYQKN